jgi:NADPH-dependent curcumin reductase CurA
MQRQINNHQWVLNRRPMRDVGPNDLELVETPVPPLEDGQILVRNIYLSLDPTHRIWMSDREQYLPPVEIGEVMRGRVMGVVEESRSERYQNGDLVTVGLGGWQRYTICSAATAQRVRQAPGVPLTAYMSVLGSTGLTAYFGMLDIGKVRSGETVVVSAAAGAVGSIAGQLAKLRGARVIGIAGGAQKCGWIVDELGFHAAIDYKNEAMGPALDRLCPQGIDLNFENVGGAIMDAVVSRMNTHGRVVVCGLISTYNQEGTAPGPSDFAWVLMRRLLIQGFIVIDYLPRAAEALAVLGPLVSDGRLKWKTHAVDGLENAGHALQRLFTGEHDGKLLVRVSPEP